MRDKSVRRIWKPAAGIHKLLLTWSRRQLDELNAADRFTYVAACADLVLHEKARAWNFVTDRLDDLPYSVMIQVRPAVGKEVIRRCVEQQQRELSLLGIDLIIEVMQSFDSIMGLPDTVFEAVLERRTQLGYEMDAARPFDRWRVDERRAYVDTFHHMVWCEFEAHDDDEEHGHRIVARQHDLFRTFHALQRRSTVLEIQVRMAMGRRIYELAREYKLCRLPLAALPLLLAHLDDLVVKGAKLDKQFARLTPELRATLDDEFEEVEEEEEARPH